MALTATTEINISVKKLKQLLISIRSGLPIRVALDRAGIPTYIYYTWLNLYESYISSLESNSSGIVEDITELEPVTIYSNKPNEKDKIVGFRYTPLSIITKIKQEYASWVEEKHNNINNSTNNKDWQSQAFLLERRVKQEYSKEETLNTNTEKVDKVIIEWMDPKEQDERIRRLQEEVKESLNNDSNN